MPGYKLYPRYVKQGKGGLLIGIKRNTFRSTLNVTSSDNRNILAVRISVSERLAYRVILAYGPQETESLEVREGFITEVSVELQNCSDNSDVPILLGDFNARVGCDHETWDALGKFGLGKMNSNGLHLLQLCTEFKLAIGNTFSHQKDTHKATWIHPRSKHGHILDYLIIRKRDLQDVCTVRVMRGADCGTDHRLIRGKMNLCIMRKKRSKGVKWAIS